MKYTPQTNQNTEFNSRRVIVRRKEDQINEIGSVEITQPANLATGISPTGDIVWGALPDYSRYRLIVTKKSDGSEVINVTVTGTSYTPSFDASTEYDIQVKVARIIPQSEASTITNVGITGASTLEQNGTTQLEETVSGTGNYSRAVIWSSSNESVATVNSSGLVTYASGAIDATVDITATSDQDGTESSTKTLTIISSSAYVPQDSRAGDEAFMQAFWDATQGDDLTVLANESELPASANELDKRKIGTDLYLYQYGEWKNKGRIWFNREGWVDGAMDLSATNISGVEVAIVGGELRIVSFDMQKHVQDGLDAIATGGNNLVGTLCPEWCNLTKCKYFNIKQNHFNGEIYDGVQQGSLFEKVSFGGQKGDKDYTNRSDWAELNHLGVDNPTVGKRLEETNQFVGPLVTTFGNCPNIELIESRRQYHTGTLPSEWGNTTSILGVFLNNQKGENPLGGALPASWGNFDPIMVKLNNNPGNDSTGTNGNYTGPVPQEWEDNWTNLANFDVVGNELSGNQPTFQLARDKKYWNTARNLFDSSQLASQFFGEFFNGDNAYISKFSCMPTSGDVPEITRPTYPGTNIVDGINNYNTISAFSLQDHGYSGDVPLWIKELMSVQNFNIINNRFTGGFLTRVATRNISRWYWVSGNPLGGTLPDITWGNGIYTILMTGCEHTGPIPDGWETGLVWAPDVRGIWRFRADGNQLDGKIPAWFRKIPSLVRFGVESNLFSSYEILADGHGFIMPPCEWRDSTTGDITTSSDPDGEVSAGFSTMTNLKFANNNLTQTDVDNILLDVQNMIEDPLFTGGGFNLTLSGNATRSSASDAAVTAIQNFGVNLDIT